ncbi:YdcH family protein [Rhizobium sp. FKY42]|uniref:YdcH family protein n=1 Tax=Rhizobium sp. FKY42 TaxID=2562310 RepID=UPI0010C12EC7|nr:YdcH family protein [Rhizobium sp. FKY42]
MTPLLKALKNRYSLIERKIELEANMPQPDPLRIMELKRFKMQMRDQITWMERSP